MRQAERQPEAPALRYREADRWRSLTWSGYASEVERVSGALMALGVEPMGKVSILGFNRPEWVVFYVGAMMAGGVPAGIYETSSPEGVAHILSHSESTVLLVENVMQLEKVVGQRRHLPALKHIVLMRGAASELPGVLGWEEFLRKGDEVQRKDIHGRLQVLKRDQPAALIYTSGTTGPPKAVMLSHRNLTWTARTAIDMFHITYEDSSLSYLPLSHIAEQMFTIHAPIIAGWRIDFAQSPEKAAENLRDVQPTIFFGVPRVWEKICAAVYPRLEEASGPEKAILRWARAVATKVHATRNEGLKEKWGLRVRYKLARGLVFSKLKAAIGLGNARFCISGAAPISAAILELFASLDIPILEVYGQSEGSGPTTFNRPGGTRFGSVGLPFPGVEVRRADDGEVHLKGPNVFLGYFKDDAATGETLIDGWLHSGDLGKFDEDGFLWITGRKKELIVTSSGKNIAPAHIEGLLRDIDGVEHAVVIGDRRKYLTALITLDEDAGENPGGETGIRDQIQREIVAVNARLSRVENIRNFRILPRRLSQGEGELTPTLKLVRHVIQENWAGLIDEMYREDA